MRLLRLIILLFFLQIVMHAQTTEIVRKGLLRAMGTISPAYLFSSSQSYYYLHGNLEGYVHRNVSLSGEIYYSVGNTAGDAALFKFNHSLFFGGSYHFVKGRHDLYFGLQPGMSLVKLNEGDSLLRTTAAGTNPVISVIGGYNFYVSRFFHFFIQNRVIVGEHNYDIPKSLTEYRFSAGLGFNINTMK